MASPRDWKDRHADMENQIWQKTLASHILLVPQEPALRALDPELELVRARDVGGGAYSAMRTWNPFHVTPHAVQLHPVPACPSAS